MSAEIAEQLVRDYGKALLTIREAAAVLGMPRQSAEQRILRGTFPIPTTRIGRRRYVTADNLLAYLRSLSTPKVTTEGAGGGQ